MALLKRHGDTFLFWCPACEEMHPFQTPQWQWNGSMESPSFTPSLRMVATGCHLVLTNGIINFCADCPHEYRGRSVPLTDLDKILGTTEDQEQLGGDMATRKEKVETQEPEEQTEVPAAVATVRQEGMKKCPSCGIYYPGGYERCPHDNAQLI
jgi:hypothetical protein